MTVGIVGLGLIGGSIGLALRQPGQVIVGFDTSVAHAQAALARFCVDRLGSLEEVMQADVVFLAVPPVQMIGTLNQIQALRTPTTVVTDCSSVKVDVVEWAHNTGADWFVGGHPMAGHEKTGPTYASSWMFRNARWLLCPSQLTDPEAVRVVEDLVKSMGAMPLRVDAVQHDRQVAVISHVPHAFAAILVLLGESLSRTDIAGGSWKDLTRVGGVDPDLWTQIFMGNRIELASALGEAQQWMEEIKSALDRNDKVAINAIFRKAAQAKRKQES